MMDHVVYVDAKANELENILNHSKTVIIRGATGRKLPYGRVFKGDVLYFIRNNGEGLIKAKATVSGVRQSEKMSRDESIRLVQDNQNGLALTSAQVKRWAGKRYIILVKITNPVPVTEFKIDRSAFGNMDDWLPVENIANVKI